MEIYILSREDLSILSVTKLVDYEINLDEETNAKSTFTLTNAEGLEKDNFLIINGLYRQFLFIIDEVQSEKDSTVSTITCLDISNIFDRKVIEENTDEMTTDSIELFLAHTISDNFVNSDDPYLNIGYIDIYVHTTTQGRVATNSENGLYNFHTFMINCRQNKNIYTVFKFENGKLRIDISYKSETTEMIDTTLPEVVDYNKIKEEDTTAKVTVLIREDGSVYNLYLKTDRTTTTNKDDPDRASGKIEVSSVDTSDMAPEEAMNIMKGNRYKHLIEFKIAKTSKLMDITKLTIGRPILIKTKEDVYESYISAITIKDKNFVYFKSGSLRDTFIDKLKATTNNYGNKLDVTSVVNNLNSNNPYVPLSAKQGKELKEITDNIRGHQLWSSSSTSRGAETLDLQDTNYDYAIIYCYRNGALDTRTESFICEKNMEIEMTYTDYYNNETRCWTRSISLNGNNATISTGTINGTANTNALCPYRIMGFKY